MKEKILMLISVLLFSIAMSSQELEPTNKMTLKESSYDADPVHKITLKEAIDTAGYGNIMRLKVVEDYSFLKNIPDIECDLFAINSFKMNQYVRADSIPNQIYLFVGINEAKKEKYVVVDVNRNYDFSDDEVYIFPIPEKPLTREEKLERCVGLEIMVDAQKNDIAHVGLDAFNYFSVKFGLRQDERLEVVITFGDYMTVATHIGDIPIEIDIKETANLFDRRFPDKSGLSIRYWDKAGKMGDKSFSKGDTIQILDKLLTLTKIEHPNIYLKEIGLLADSSIVGSHMPVVYSRNLDADDNIRINDLAKDKYIFIDFWGSWCGPCIASIPKLRNFYEKVKDRQDVLVLGIAKEEDRNDLDKLKGIISNKEIGWLNLWLSNEESKISTSIIKKLNIQAFPTYLIVDKEGKIVYKEKSMYKTEEAIDFFLDMINK